VDPREVSAFDAGDCAAHDVLGKVPRVPLGHSFIERLHQDTTGSGRQGLGDRYELKAHLFQLLLEVLGDSAGPGEAVEVPHKDVLEVIAVGFLHQRA